MKAPANKQAKKSRILIADDHPLFREGLVQLINTEGDLRCCGQTSTVQSTEAAVERLKPDLFV